MSKPVVVAILTFPGCQVLDVTGPAMVFEGGNNALDKVYYKVHIVSAEGGPIKTSCAVTLDTVPIAALSPASIDTLLLAGGDECGLEQLAEDQSVRKWVISTSKKARRYGSICTGAFALAGFGLLDGKRVATHWSKCADLAERWPGVEVDSNALFVNEDRLWTSAGVTTGIDMSLEMVSVDLGNTVAHAIAKRLVLYSRRPGYQAQFSPMLSAQSQAEAPFAALIHWMRENLAQPLDVPRLADKVAMSERTFLRKFTQSMGETPAHFVETLRLDQTRNLLAAGLSLKDIAAKTGYLTAAQLSKAFDRRFGMTPVLFRKLHCHSSG
jgi:transcriptional regulator GlxA family with amidase domain